MPGINNGKPRSSSTKNGASSGQGAAASRTYVDIIDKLDLSGIGGGLHHSGPFDAALARSKTRPDRPAPIAAFSSDSLSSAVSSKGADTAPLRDRYERESSYPSSNRAYGGSGSGSGNGGGAGISARAKAAMSALDWEDGSGTNDPNMSSDHLLGSPSGSSTYSTRRGRRNSESSITLGYPVAGTEKERQYLEAFGVHSEAFEDYGRSSYARKPPRASVYPTDKRPGMSGLSKEGRADRTASIWDIEATLREGRPVASSGAPPPMPIIPDQYLTGASPSSSTLAPPPVPGQDGSGVKRSKSLISRMRSKKHGGSGSVSANNSPETNKGSSRFGGVSPNLSGQEWEASASFSPSSSSATPNASGLPKSRSRSPAAINETNGAGGSRSGSGSPAVSPPSYSSAAGITSKRSDPLLSPSAGVGRKMAGLNVRSPPPVSPLDLPEGPAYPFPDASASRNRGGLARSGRYEDLANESATAAILAESSSKESQISGLSSASSSNNAGADTSASTAGYGGGNNTSFASTAGGDLSYNTATSADVSGAYANGDEKENSPVEGGNTSGSGKSLSRKSSFAKRFFRGGGKKKNSG